MLDAGLRRAFGARLAALLTAVLVVLGMGLVGVRPAGADTTIPVHDMKTEKVPADYANFSFDLASGVKQSQITDVSGFTVTTDDNSTYYTPSQVGATLTVNHVSQWLDDNGDLQWINMKFTVNSYNAGRFRLLHSTEALEQDTRGTASSSGRRYLDVTVDFLLDDGSYPGSAFKGSFGFSDLDGNDSVFSASLACEGVELLEGFDAAYVRSDAHLTTFGTNGWAGIKDSMDDGIASTHGLQHYLGATTSSHTVRFSYSCPNNKTFGSTITSLMQALVASPDVSVSKTAGASSAAVGEAVEYTVTATNSGDGVAYHQSVFDVLGDGLEFVEASDGGVFDEATRTVTWADVRLDADGGSRSFTVKARPVASAGVEVSNTATTCQGDGCVPEACADDACEAVVGVENTVSVKGKDGFADVSGSVTVPNGGKVSKDKLDAVAQKTGYTVTGYVNAADGTVWDCGAEVRGNVTLNPQYELDAPGVTVNQDKDRLETVSDKATVTLDVTKPVDSATEQVVWSKDGKELAACKDKEVCEVTEPGTYKVTVTTTDPATKVSSKTEKEFTILAPEERVVTVKGKDGFSDVSGSVKVANGGTVSKDKLDAIAQKMGYTVTGYADAADGSVWDCAAPVLADVTLNPQYALDEPGVTVTPDKTVLETGSDKATVTVDVTKPVAGATEQIVWSKDGQELAGCRDGKVCEVTEPGEYKVTVTTTDPATGVSSEASREFTIRGEYPIAYELDGGTLPADAPTSHAYGQATTLPTPTRTGYRFDGWTDETGNAIAAVPATAKDVTVTAHWTADSNRVVFAQGDHGTLSGTTEYTVKSGEKVPGRPTVNADAGWTFVGWQSSESDLVLVYADGGITDYVVSGANPTVTFTAQYVQNVKCTVVFNANGGVFGDRGSLTVLTDAKGKAYTVPADPTRDGYTFAGWDATPSGVFDTEGVTLYLAKWTENTDKDSGKDKTDGDGKGDATYDPNGGKMPDGWTGEDGKLPVPTRDGYKFDGWYDEDGNLVTTLEQAAGKTLHARWTKLDGLASTGATGLAAGLTALALTAAGLAVGAVRRRRSR